MSALEGKVAIVTGVAVGPSQPVRRLLLDAGLTPEQALFHYEWPAHGRRHAHVAGRGLPPQGRRGPRRAVRHIARTEPRASRLPALAITSDQDALFTAQIELHVQAIRAAATATPGIAP